MDADVFDSGEGVSEAAAAVDGVEVSSGGTSVMRIPSSHSPVTAVHRTGRVRNRPNAMIPCRTSRLGATELWRIPVRCHRTPLQRIIVLPPRKWVGLRCANGMTWPVRTDRSSGATLWQCTRMRSISIRSAMQCHAW